MLEKYITRLKLKERFSKERFSVGLDIGTSAIKLIKLKSSKGILELCGFALEPIELDLELALKRIAESCATKKVNLSISGSSTVIRYVNFPKMSADELKQALKFEAPNHIPFPVNEVNLDGYILKEDLPENKMLVLLAAVKKELINQRLKLIQGLGFQPHIIDIDSIALVNAFHHSQDDNLKKDKTIILLNIGALMSNLNILEDGLPRLSRDIYIAGNTLTQKLREDFNLDFKSAEQLKLNPDKEGLDKVCSAAEAVVSNLANEIRISFDYYESQSASTVSKVFLSGGGSKFSPLKEMLANLLGKIGRAHV